MFGQSQIAINLFKFKRKLVFYATKLLTTAANVEQQKPLNILFFGTDNFSLPSLQALHQYSLKHATRLTVVTSFKSPVNCVRQYAQPSLPLLRWPLEAKVCQDYDLGVVVSFGHLIPEQIIKALPLGMINVHASLLPRWRGAAPIIYAIIHGDAETGVSIMQIEPKHFDVGDILAQKQVQIDAHVLLPELHAQLAHLGAELLMDTIANFTQRWRDRKKQNSAVATLAPKVTGALTQISWFELNAQQLYNRYRALYGFKHLLAKFQQRNVLLLQLKLPTAVTASRFPAAQTTPGSFVYLRDQKCLLVRCAQNTFLEIHQLRLEGKQAMSAQDFYNGFLSKLSSQEILFCCSNKV